MSNRYLEMEKLLTKRLSTKAVQASYAPAYPHSKGSYGYAYTASIPAHVLERARRFEGAIPHLYLDTVGAVTVGVGRMLPSAAATAKLIFIRNVDSKLASELEKKDEWELISSKEKGKSAGWYKQFTSLHLSESAIDTLLTEDMTRVQSRLQANFPDFDRFPSSAQEGLLDMVFNLGESGLMNKFPKFVDAVKKQDWKTASSECKRSGIPQSRNEEVKKLFEDAATS